MNPVVVGSGLTEITDQVLPGSTTIDASSYANGPAQGLVDLVCLGNRGRSKPSIAIQPNPYQVNVCEFRAAPTPTRT